MVWTGRAAQGKAGRKRFCERGRPPLFPGETVPAREAALYRTAVIAAKRNASDRRVRHRRRALAASVCVSVCKKRVFLRVGIRRMDMQRRRWVPYMMHSLLCGQSRMWSTDTYLIRNLDARLARRGSHFPVFQIVGEWCAINLWEPRTDLLRCDECCARSAYVRAKEKQKKHTYTVAQNSRADGRPVYLAHDALVSDMAMGSRFHPSRAGRLWGWLTIIGNGLLERDMTWGYPVDLVILFSAFSFFVTHKV